jgi:2-methylcitrate dehydratase PrpD
VKISSKAREGLTAALAEYAVNARFADMPADVVDSAKRVTLDTLGCIVLGSTLPGGDIMAKYIRTIGSNGTSTVVGKDFTTAPALAALTNGTSAHSDELDGSHKSWGHPAGPAVAVALATCELENKGGAELLNAVALMHDVGARVFTALGSRSAILQTHHIHSTGPYSIGTAAAAANVLGLTQMQCQYAMGIALMKVFSTGAFFDEREHMTKAMTHGQSAYAGVTGALLAREGFEANEAVIEARHGLIDAWGTDEMNLDLFTEDLGSHYSVTDTAFKYYSAGYPIHAPLHAALTLVKEHGIDTADITAVTVAMASAAAEIVDTRDMPSISVQDMVSLGMVLGKLSYEDAHDAEALARPEVQRLKSTITITPDPELAKMGSHHRASWVAITTSAGTVRSQVHRPPGHWETGGMPWSDAEAKFESLVEPRLGAKACAGLIDIARNLEKYESLEDLVRLLRK